MKATRTLPARQEAFRTKHGRKPRKDVGKPHWGARKFNAAQIRGMRTLAARKNDRRDIADLYCVSLGTLSRILSRKIYSEVE